MLAFYPEFETDPVTDNEIVMVLDLSNSMKVGPLNLQIIVSFQSDTCLS